MNLIKFHLMNISIICLCLCSCAMKNKEVSIDEYKRKIVSQIKLSDGVITDLKDNQTAGERYGVSPSKISEGFAYTNGESVEKADEIIVIKANDKKNVIEIEKALGREVTNMLSAWEGVDDGEYKKIQKHVLRSNGNFIMLAITDDSKKAEKIFTEEC